MLKEKVYIGGRAAAVTKDEPTVVVYDPKQDSCDTLPPYTYKWFSMAVVSDQLVLVGGRDSFYKKTNKLGVWNEWSETWTYPLPPMTTACSSPSVTTHKNRWLVVMGGSGDETSLSRVEILDTTEPVQWYQAASLPQSCYQLSSATIGDICYLLGGFTREGPSKKVFRVCLDDLIPQAASQPTSTSVPLTPSPWQSLLDTPLHQSTALAFNGALLVVGGGVYPGRSTVYMYHPRRKCWFKAGELPNKRHTCGCIVLPSGEMLVSGGGDDEMRQQIEIASIL